jgi:hypothetical protein
MILWRISNYADLDGRGAKNRIKSLITVPFYEKANGQRDGLAGKGPAT